MSGPPQSDDGARGRSAISDLGQFRLYEHPWLALVAVPGFLALSVFLVGSLFLTFRLPDSPVWQFLRTSAFHLLFILVVAPYLLGLPSGRQPLTAYLDEIRLTRVRPLGRLLLLGLSCYLVLAVSQGLGVIVYRLTLAEPLTVEFVIQVFDVSGDLPPESGSLLVALPSAFEEVEFRGVLLFTLLYTFTKREAIVASAVSFGLLHLLNVTSGGVDPVWVLGQVGWTCIIGIFYAYTVVQTDSLLPAMIVHYLGNAFIGSITWYLQQTASVETQVAYGLVFSLGVVPVVLMSIWVRVFADRWLPADQAVDPPVRHDETTG